VKVALGAFKCDRVIVPKNLDCNHRERVITDVGTRRLSASARKNPTFLVTCLTDTALRSNRDSKNFLIRIKEDIDRIMARADVEASRTGNSGVGSCLFQSKSGNERPTQLETPCRLLTASMEELSG